eukprot:CAMPEP_0204532266 /NCGR_PEP_ID=MMETSP0661-20131031/11631_1 /ASSEMBLY_ACC=CAM_ASM_000606 /TAXON_ID=109239 /ORGANISM="Alexandrium margalefi, Strain AMGDE01CS-322" /LENGTH=363 /DNA_ID=CAMNT_0051538497 /DNA_START=77 /DNA_END=1168 /DNA_ORIENTATION=+
MAVLSRAALLALATLTGLASGLRMEAAGLKPTEAASRAGCERDDVAFGQIAWQACNINKELLADTPAQWAEHVNMGCWKMLAYTSDAHLTSVLYQDKNDGRCTLGLSGIHADQMGFAKGVGLMVWPPVIEKVCGGHVYAPFVKELRRHTALANWSRMIDIFGGPNTVCKGDRILTADSLGGPLSEILAFCWNQGIGDEIQNASIPAPPIDVLYTFGSPGSATRPLTNARSKDGCFRGRRVFNFADIIAHLGGTVGMKHARVDALEIWPGKQPAVKKWGCKSGEAVNDATHPKPPPVSKGDSQRDFNAGITQHELPSYIEDINWLESAGKHKEAGTNPDGSLAAYTAKYNNTLESYLHMYKYGR